MSLPRHFSLYNGVSERSRGWKSKRLDRTTEGQTSHTLYIRRWDGAARSSSSWDYLRRDPELWFRDGDCYVHLHGQGQSRRGPAFKVPFAALLASDCYPLLERFMTNEVPETALSSENGRDQHAHFAKLSQQSRIELYIPAPPGSDKQQAYNYHLATRNLIAFIFRRSLVGEHLGGALISLLHSMHESRTIDVDNLSDLMGYMDEEGYLDLKDRPAHALALLHFAETFQLRDLYIEAFAHCCGMHDRLFGNSEYQVVSSVSRKLLRHASVEAEAKLGQMGKMLSGFLEDELSEAYLGLHSGARAHMERFRTLIHGFYANKFGYFPPPSIHPRTTIFEVDIFRTLRNDFEALYDYLVDETFDISRGSLPSAQGGLCALQSVQSFDARCKFTTLNHPIPLLPNIRPQAFSKRLTWFGKQSKLSASQRTATYIALVKATNENNIELLDNDLVRAYRKFEEESIYSPIKGDKQEQLGHIDARKVRWILVYAVYQALRQVTQPPVEVKDFVGAPYNLCIPTINLPPWKEAKSMPPCTKIHTTAIPRNPSASATGWGVSTGVQTQPDTPTFDIKPDIDYLGLLNKEAASSVPSRQAVLPGAETPAIRRTGLTRSLSRNGTFRRSLRLFGHQEIEKCAPAHHRKSQQYHEIVVLGYGNGTQDVEFTPLDDESGIALMISETKNPATASRSPSTASQSSRSADDSSSEDGSASTVDTSLTESVGNSPVVQTSPNPWTLNRNKSFCGRGPPLEERDYTPRAMSLRSSSMPPAVLFCPEKSEEQPGKGVKQRRSQTLLDRYRKSLEPEPLEIRKTASLKFGKRQRVSSRIDQASSEELWDDIRSFTEMRTMSLKSVDVGLDSYNDLGGFTELHDVLPRRLSTIF